MHQPGIHAFGLGQCQQVGACLFAAHIFTLVFSGGGRGESGDTLRHDGVSVRGAWGRGGTLGAKARAAEYGVNTHSSPHNAGVTAYTRALRPSGSRVLRVSRPSPARCMASWSAST